MDARENSEKDRRLESQIEEHQQHLKLNASELGDLWGNYMGDSMYICIFEHFLEVVQDEEIKEMLLFGRGISKRHTATIADLFKKEGIPVPSGFSSSDVNKGAPRLFDDSFMLFYLRQMAIGAYGEYTRALSGTIRQDVMDFYRQGIQELNEIYERTTHLQTAKGTIIKTPKIPYPKKVEFVDKKMFNSFIKNRPIASVEIKYLYRNITFNTLGKSLMMGFAQVASAKKIRKFFQEGWELADKQIKQYGTILTNDNISSPMLMDPHVTDFMIPPFSDKLMMYHVGLANKLGLENLGTAMSRSLRHDINAKYAKFLTEIVTYANQGQQLMINHGWFEQPPLAADRQEIVDSPH